MGHRPFHRWRLFFCGFLSAASLGNATTPGCGKLLSLKHPLETPARRRKAPFWQASGSDLQSSPQDTQRWGRAENKMWMGGAKGIWGLRLHWPQPSMSFWYFSPTGDGVDTKRYQVEKCKMKISTLFTRKVSLVAEHPLPSHTRTHTHTKKQPKNPRVND